MQPTTTSCMKTTTTMPVRASAESVHPMSLFPTADANPGARDASATPRERPTKVGPIYDPEHSSQPITSWDDIFKAHNYTDALKDNLAAEVPPQPKGFNDEYLHPMLAKNERQRLTMLWYYTRNIASDPELMKRLEEKIELVRALLGWDFAIMGILSNNNYIRFAASGLPLAILPRRESTCAHTINQRAGSVFWLDDMKNDWRFKDSPHVAHAGLQSYAGTQLRFHTNNGEELALGSLCIASESACAPLTPEKKEALIRFATMFTDEIINGARIQRHRMRQHMTELVAEIQRQSDEPDIDTIVINTIRKVYPEALVTLQSSENAMIDVRGRDACSYESFTDGLWEDTECLDQLITEHNHEELVANQTVRAIVGNCGNIPTRRYLVVDSMEVEFVFDDIDAWFVERCSLILCNIWQKRFIEDALRAKEVFLRGITHQLRTPIHGVLASSELLAEALAQNDKEFFTATSLPTKNNASAILSTIQSSGRELMGTVNNILKLNTWASMTSGGAIKMQEYDLTNIEQRIWRNVAEHLPAREATYPPVLFDDRLQPGTILSTNPDLLLECLSSLVINALTFTESGWINVVCSSTAGHINFDVMDTGCGIDAQDHDRIFKPFEKVDPHARGAGLGLTLASKIAAALSGHVALVESVAGAGSYFRASFACLDARDPSPESQSRNHAHKQYHILPETSSNKIHPMAAFLEHRGLTKASTPRDALIIVDGTQNDGVISLLDEQDISPDQLIICLTAAMKTSASNEAAPNHLQISTPFFTSHLNDLLNAKNQSLHSRTSSQHQRPPCTSKASFFTDTNGVSPTRSTRGGDDLSALSLHSPPLQSSPRSEPSPPQHSLPSALLVDDNPVNLQILKVYCEKRGIPYVTATDGKQAVDIFEGQRAERGINLVLMDLQMPILDGISATAEIRAMEFSSTLTPSSPSHQASSSHRSSLHTAITANDTMTANISPTSQARTVIFMITGQDSPSDRSRSTLAGADEYHVKPVSIKVLDQAVGKWFRDFVPAKQQQGSAMPRKARMNGKSVGGENVGDGGNVGSDGNAREGGDGKGECGPTKNLPTDGKEEDERGRERLQPVRTNTNDGTLITEVRRLSRDGRLDEEEAVLGTGSPT